MKPLVPNCVCPEGIKATHFFPHYSLTPLLSLHNRINYTTKMQFPTLALAALASVAQAQNASNVSSSVSSGYANSNLISTGVVAAAVAGVAAMLI